MADNLVTSPPVRPIDASGLILLRRKRGGLEVLIGRRHGRSGFMPNVYVVPGGRLEAADRVLSASAPAQLVLPDGLDRRSRQLGAALLQAALRETREETGLTIAPDRTLDIRLVARAITPVCSPKRFHTRFFLAPGELALGRLGGDGELEDLHWRNFEKLDEVPVADVTQLVLEEARRHYLGGSGCDRPAALFTWVGPEMRDRHRLGPTPPRT